MNPRHLAAATSLGIGTVAVLVLLQLLSGGTPRTAAAPECRPLWAPGDVITVCLSGGCDYTSTQAAVDAASDGDVIKVATGIYTAAGVTQVVYISRTITVQGGYTITNWSNSDPISYPTTLDAEGRGRGMVITGPITVTVEGLRITGGDATGLGGDPSGLDAGGGVYVVNAAATIRNNRVFSNTAGLGAGLYARNSASLTLAANRIYSNASAIYCGGMLIRECANATVAGNAVHNNMAVEGGGGLYLYHSDDVLLHENRIHNNYTTIPTGSGAGAILVESTGVVFQGNHLWGNRCDYWGGGMLILTSSHTIVRGNAFYLNTAWQGGGLFVRASMNTLVDRNAVFSNTATAGGGAIFLRASDAVLTNNFFVENDAGGRGAGIATGSGILLTPTTAILLHNTFAANDDDAICVGLTSTLRLTNTIISSHRVGISVITPTAVVTAAHTLWWATSIYTDDSGGGSIVTAEDRTGDPAFVGGQVTPGDVRAYHIARRSAARDEGESTEVFTDYDGDMRPFGLHPDIGADEYPFAARTVYPKQAGPCALSYTVFITNGGSTTATMGMTHALPARLRYAGPTSCTPGTCGYQAASRAITWTGAVPPTSTASVTYLLHADYPAIATTVPHTARISTPLDLFETSRVTTTVRVQPPIAAIDQRSSHHPSPDGHATIGEVVTYTLYFTLPQGTGVYTAAVVGSLPRLVDSSGSPQASPALTYVAGSGIPPTVSVSPDGGTMTWPSRTVTAPCGTSGVIPVAFQAQVRNHPENNCTDVLQSIAALSYTDSSGGASLAVTTTHVITLQEPDAWLASEIISPTFGARPGDILTVTLTFGNDGPGSQSPLYDVVLTDVLPSWTTYHGVVGGTPVPTLSGGILTWTVASMAPGGKDVYTFTVRVADDVPPGETLTNTARIWGSSLPGVQAGERDGDNAAGPAVQLYRETVQCTVEVCRCVYLPLVLVGSVAFSAKVRK